MLSTDISSLRPSHYLLNERSVANQNYPESAVADAAVLVASSDAKAFVGRRAVVTAVVVAAAEIVALEVVQLQPYLVVMIEVSYHDFVHSVSARAACVAELVCYAETVEAVAAGAVVVVAAAFVAAVEVVAVVVEVAVVVAAAAV